MKLTFMERLRLTDRLNTQMRLSGAHYPNYTRATDDLMRFFRNDPKEYQIDGKIDELTARYA